MVAHFALNHIILCSNTDVFALVCFNETVWFGVREGNAARCTLAHSGTITGNEQRAWQTDKHSIFRIHFKPPLHASHELKKLKLQNKTNIKRKFIPFWMYADYRIA